MLTAGFSINVLTMFAMVLAIGILVDDAIVVVENVRRIMSKRPVPQEAATKAMPQISGAVVGMTLVLSTVFSAGLHVGFGWRHLPSVCHHHGGIDPVLRFSGAYVHARAVPPFLSLWQDGHTKKRGFLVGSTARSTGSPTAMRGG